MNDLVLNIVVFISVLCLTVGLLSFISGLRGVATESDMSATNVLLDSPIGFMVSFLAGFNQRGWCSNHRSGIEKKLIYAGRPGGAITASQYMAAAELVGISLFLVMLVIGAINGSILVLGVFVGLITAIIGYWFTIEYLSNLVTDRRLFISRQFPNFLDLAVMTTQAGASFLETLEIYVTNNRNNALATELGLVLSDIQMGSTTEESLRGFQNRVPIESLRNAVDAIIQGQNMGTPIADVLSEQGDIIRFHRSQAAERAAEELKVKIMGPIILMMISIFLLILGPAVIEIMQSEVF